MSKLATGLVTLAVATTVAAQPYGPGMMGGAGPGGWGSGYGPGMMGGWGGGYGPGMMDGGMGPGMMWGPGGGALADLDLSKEQRDKIAQIQSEVRRQHWATMRAMQQQEWHMADAWRDDGSFDEQAARKAFDAMTAQRKAMFDLMLDARKRIDALLTPAQREQLKRRGGGR